MAILRQLALTLFVLLFFANSALAVPIMVQDAVRILERVAGGGFENQRELNFLQGESDESTSVGPVTMPDLPGVQLPNPGNTLKREISLTEPGDGANESDRVTATLEQTLQKVVKLRIFLDSDKEESRGFPKPLHVEETGGLQDMTTWVFFGQATFPQGVDPQKFPIKVEVLSCIVEAAPKSNGDEGCTIDVPEPSTLLLLGSGLVGVVVVLRRFPRRTLNESFFHQISPSNRRRAG